MPQIGSKIVKNGVKIEKRALKSAEFDVFGTFQIKKGVNPNSPLAALIGPQYRAKRKSLIFVVELL